MLYLAIDQHSKQLTVNVRDEAGQVLRRKQVSTRGSAAYDFLTQLSAEAGDTGYAAIVEVCGFNDWLLDQLPNYGCREIVLVQPDKRPTRKTDHRDANQLGEILWVNRQRLLTKLRVQGLRRVHIPTEIERDDRRLAALRHRNGRETTRIINSVRTILRRRNLQHDCPTKTIQAKRARVWLDQLELAPLDRLELNQLLARWDQLIAQRRARSGHRRTRSALPRGELSHAPQRRSLHGAGTLGAHRRHPAVRTPAKSGELLGTHTRLPQLGRERTTPGRHHQARQHARGFLLGQLVMHVLKRDGKLRHWYLNIKRRRGAKIARVAVMRRSATIIWHMLTHQEDYAFAGRTRAQREAITTTT